MKPLLIIIAGRVGHSFEVKTMIKGFGVHARGMTVTASGEKSATVETAPLRGRSFIVTFRAGKVGLIAGCSCSTPQAERPCRHMWAALLEIDKQGGLTAFRMRRGPITLSCPPGKKEKKDARRVG